MALKVFFYSSVLFSFPLLSSAMGDGPSKYREFIHDGSELPGKNVDETFIEVWNDLIIGKTYPEETRIYGGIRIGLSLKRGKLKLFRLDGAIQIIETLWKFFGEVADSTSSKGMMGI